MRKILSFLILALAPLVSAAGQQKITFMPNWTPQAQFAGYYVAKEKGFFDELGLDVTIKSLNAGSSRYIMDYLQNGETDICTSQLVSAMIDKGTGKDIVNVLQVSQNTGLMLVSRYPMESFHDMEGMKIGRWKSNYFEIAELFCQDYNINVDWIPYLHNVNIFISGAVDATLCFSYNEYFNILFAQGVVPKEQTLRFSDLGYNFPEDAVFTTRYFYENNRPAVDKFIAATKRGWEYAREHREEAVDIVMKYVKANNVATNRTFQKFMLDEVLELQINKETGKADYKKVDERIIDLLNDSLMNLKKEFRPVMYKEFIK